MTILYILPATVHHTVKPEMTTPANKPSDTPRSFLFAHKIPYSLGGSGFFTCIVSVARVVARGIATQASMRFFISSPFY